MDEHADALRKLQVHPRRRWTYNTGGHIHGITARSPQRAATKPCHRSSTEQAGLPITPTRDPAGCYDAHN
jgi:hypothetical protein